MADAFPRSRQIASFASRLERDFKRLKAKRAGRPQGPLTDAELDFLTTYEFHVLRLADKHGVAAVTAACKDLADVLGCGEAPVSEFFAGVKEEFTPGKRLRDTGVSAEGGLRVNLDLGNIIEREVEARIAMLRMREEGNEGPAGAAGPSSEACQSPAASQAPRAAASHPSASQHHRYINDIDRVAFPTNWNFILTNEYGLNTQFSDLKQACRCSPLSNCKGERLCPCAQFSAKNSPAGALYYSGTGSAKRLPAVATGRPQIYECSTDCQCNKDRCGLSFTTQGLDRAATRQLAAVRSGSTEPVWSVATLDAIGKDEFVLEVTGEVIGEADYQAREDPWIAYLDGSGKDTWYLDYRLRGNLGKFLAHSCAPNLAIVRTHMGLKDPKLTRLMLYTVRAVKSLEELTINWEQLLGIKNRWKCDCGAANCRGFIGP